MPRVEMITIFTAESAGARSGGSWEDPRVSRRPSPRKMPEIRSARFTRRVNTVSESRPSHLYRRNALSSRRGASRTSQQSALCHNTRSIIRETNNLPLIPSLKKKQYNISSLDSGFLIFQSMNLLVSLARLAITKSKHKELFDHLIKFKIDFCQWKL